MCVRNPLSKTSYVIGCRFAVRTGVVLLSRLIVSQRAKIFSFVLVEIYELESALIAFFISLELNDWHRLRDANCDSTFCSIEFNFEKKFQNVESL